MSTYKIISAKKTDGLTYYYICSGSKSDSEGFAELVANPSKATTVFPTNLQLVSCVGSVYVLVDSFCVDSGITTTPVTTTTIKQIPSYLQKLGIVYDVTNHAFVLQANTTVAVEVNITDKSGVLINGADWDSNNFYPLVDGSTYSIYNKHRNFYPKTFAVDGIVQNKKYYLTIRPVNTTDNYEVSFFAPAQNTTTPVDIALI